MNMMDTNMKNHLLTFCEHNVENSGREDMRTSPPSNKAKHMLTYRNLNALLIDKIKVEKSEWQIEEKMPSDGGETSKCPQDFNASYSSVKTENTVDQEPQMLLHQPMLGDFPTAWKNQSAFSSKTSPKPPIAPLLADGDHGLLPLASPTQELSPSLCPEGQWALETLFQDVWIKPEPTVLNSPSLPPSDQNQASFASTDLQKPIKTEEDGKESSEVSIPPLKRATKVEKKTPPKKKCVNGFIMFCQIHRKAYTDYYPGTPSTVVTRELAQLWHVMPKRERHLYCLKAWSFSCKQNRNVRTQFHEMDMKAKHRNPSPLHLLLAYREQVLGIYNLKNKKRD